MRTLAELATARAEIETLIMSAHCGQARTDRERAEHADTLHKLHARLADVLTEVEMVASVDVALWDSGIVSALRWSVTGAQMTADYWRDSAIAWRDLADAADVVAQHVGVSER